MLTYELNGFDVNMVRKPVLVLLSIFFDYICDLSISKIFIVRRLCSITLIMTRHNENK